MEWGQISRERTLRPKAPATHSRTYEPHVMDEEVRREQVSKAAWLQLE